MIAAFLAWWFGQLAELLPSWLRRSTPANADALVITPREPLDQTRTVAVGVRRNGIQQPLGEFALAAPELRQMPRSPNRPPVLRVTKADVLEKTLNVPIAAQGDLNQVLAFEMDRETPFTPDEVYWVYNVESVDRQRGRLAVRLLLMPKASINHLLSALAQAGIVPRWAEIADGGAASPVLPLNGGRGRPQQPSRRLVWAAAICCAVLAVAVIATPFARQSITLAALDREIALGRSTAAQAENIKRETDRLMRSADLVKSELRKVGRPLEILAAATRLLPDDTYLMELELRQRKLTLSGRSAGAARLIGALAADGTFRNPTFAAPVTRIEALKVEVFTIVAEIEPTP